MAQGWRFVGLAAVLSIAGAGCDGGGGGSGGGGGGGGSGEECAEIFAYGFRNPWRMNFDPATGKLYVGDVGQSAQEEIDLVTSGGNYGWDCLEGELPHTTTATCAGVTFVPPEVVHGRSEAFAITGGAVYRGSAIPALEGYYVYGDFGTGLFWAFDSEVADAPSQRLTTLPSTSVTAFGQDRSGEVYVVGFDSPSIQRIVGSGLASLGLVDAFPGRSFAQPVKLLQHPTNGARWYVVEQGGLVKTFLSTDSNTPTHAVDVRGVANFVSGGERGLLGMAFDPNFASSGEIYLAYTTSGSSVLARWVSDDGGLTFEADSLPVVLSIPDPFANHNGGDIMFGPDGFLYYSMGDGGGADDPFDTGQDRETLLGKILRLDVNSTPPSGKTYAIPASNPFASNAQCNTGSR